MEAMEPRRAVVIGVDRYKDGTIRELKGARYDAKEVHDRLIDPEIGNFEILDRHYLLSEDATSDAIRHAISDLFWKVDFCPFSLFYFSGHGFQDSYGNGYIMPYDMIPEAPLVRGIRMQELTGLIQAAQNKKTILVILDCCYSGIAAESGIDAEVRGEAPLAEQPPIKQWFAPLDDEDRGSGKVILASSGQDEKSWEQARCVHMFGEQGEHPHGRFTFHLLEGLDGHAVTSESDEVTLEGLLKHIEKQMQNDPRHQPTFSGAGVRQAGQIAIARAKRWRDTEQKIQEARELLNIGNPRETFGAVEMLGEIRCPKMQRVVNIKEELEQRLLQYRPDAIYWLLSRGGLGIRCRESYSCLSDLAQNLSVDAANAVLENDPSMFRLMATLCEASFKQRAADACNAEKTFEAQLKAHHVHHSVNQPPRAATPKASGGEN